MRESVLSYFGLNQEESSMLSGKGCERLYPNLHVGCRRSQVRFGQARRVYEDWTISSPLRRLLCSDSNTIFMHTSLSQQEVKLTRSPGQSRARAFPSGS